MSTTTNPQKSVSNGEQTEKRLIETGNRGLRLQSLDDMWRFSQMVAASGLAPKGVDTPQAILIAVQMGAELGMAPMASLQNIAVINGKPSVYGDAVLGVVRSSGVFDEEAFEETFFGEGDDETAVCQVRRRGGKLISRAFSVAAAKKAGLWGKAGPWTQYPRRMLQMRARAYALRDGFADVLRGFPVAEEVMDIPHQAAPRVEKVEDPLLGLEAAVKPESEPQPQQEPQAEDAGSMTLPPQGWRVDALTAINACMGEGAVLETGNRLRGQVPEEDADGAAWLLEQVERRCAEIKAGSKGRGKKQGELV